MNLLILKFVICTFMYFKAYVLNGASARVDTQMAQPERVVNECGHNSRMFSKARS